MSFSNILPPGSPKVDPEQLRKAVEYLKKGMGAVPPEARIIVPPDWETSLPPEVVAEIKRRCGL